jgi:acetylornithine deacetylase/succinyl-diaminopimelate desuccinylase-like protein
MLGLVLLAASVSAQDMTALRAETREHLKALIRFDTSNPPGNELVAAEYLKKVLEKDGIPSQIYVSTGARASLIARLKGAGPGKALLLMCHTDVVPADRSEWSTDPFTPVEKDGYLYGRGSADVKSMCAVEAAILAQLKRSAVPLRRDVVFFAEADEEAGGSGRHIDWLLEHHREALDAEFGINEGGDTAWKDGRPAELRVEASEKIFVDFKLTARGSAGHSSVPRTDNAVAALSRAVAKLAAWKPNADLQPVARQFLEASSRRSSGELRRAIEAALAAEPGPGLEAAADEISRLEPDFGAMLRDTIVPTMLNAGYKSNVIPAEATAVLNARLLPGHSAAVFARRVADVIGDAAVEVSYDAPSAEAPARPARGPLWDAISAASAASAPGVPVGPFMAAWTTDSQPLRALGIEMAGIDPPLSEYCVHAKDERIPLAGLDWYAGLLSA